MSAPALPAPALPAPALPGRCRPSVRPARAVRIGVVPRPRVRPLADVLAELVRPAPAIPLTPEPRPVAPTPVPVPTSVPRSESPETRTAVLRLLQAVVEVVDGVRAPAHLQRVCRDDLDLGALLAHRAAPGARAQRGRLRGVRVCPVTPGAVEAAGVVHRGGRARALVARLEHDGDTWRFAALALL